MRVIPGNAQHRGDREYQEDAFGFSSLADRGFKRHGGVMMVLCDGMGGLANGAAASRAAVDAALCGYSRKGASEDIPSALDRALRDAHKAVCAICGEGGAAGSTIVMAVVWQDRLYWASLGDSRLYLCRKGAPARQLTEDDNAAALLEERLARGESSEDEAALAANPDALTAYLGAPYPPQPHMGRDGLPLRSGDRVVACSDGLYRGLSPADMAAIARRGDPMTSAEQMIRSVLEKRLPDQDNLSAVLLEVSSHRRPIEIIKTAGPAARGILCGAIGFGAAAALGGVLFVFGVLSFGPRGVAPPQTSSGIPAAPAAAAAPPPTAAGHPPAATGGGAPLAPIKTSPKRPSTATPAPWARFSKRGHRFDNGVSLLGKRDSGSPNGTFIANESDPPATLAPDAVELWVSGQRILLGSPGNRLVPELS
jgi:protein phosphatase